MNAVIFYLEDIEGTNMVRVSYELIGDPGVSYAVSQKLMEYLADGQPVKLATESIFTRPTTGMVQ